ncbi:MAG: DUF421 domain-containing protein [Actinomycetota bacterium]|nr:DUF421 domain-containing protein [Actinomycetota bacterium]
MTDGILSELGLSWAEVWLTVVTAAGIYATVILLSRMFGQRQFATSSTYDLAFIFAMGSLVGRVILVRTSLLAAVLGLFTMFCLHAAARWLHQNVGVMHMAIQNRPILVVADGDVLEDNRRRAHLSHFELYQQLRLHGLGSLEKVRAVILERNGDLSIITADQRIDAEVFREVVGNDRLVHRSK